MKNRLQFFWVVLLLLIGGSSFANTASFTWTSECEGTQTFFVSTSTASSGTIVSWQWDFDNDGFFDEATGATASWLFPGDGTFSVGLRIATSTAQFDTIYQQVIVNPVPDVSFTAPSVCAGTPTILTDATSGSIVSWQWELSGDSLFDDASGSSISNTYPGTGTYTAGLRVATDSGCTSFVYQSVTVNPNPTVGFTFDNVCIGDITEFTGSANVTTGFISAYDWELNGNSMYDDASGQNITNQFISTGNYQVGLRVTTDQGCQADTSILVTIAPLPYINFSFNGQCEDTPVNFTNLSSNQVGTITYDWDFGDNTSSNAVSPTHTFASSGIFNVQLTGTTSFGCIDSLTQSITINATPKSDFDYTEVCFGEETDFTNISSAQGATIQSYFWDLGDDEVSIAPNPHHTYEEPGTYDVSLVVYSTLGCRDTITHQVNVWELPDATITASGLIAFCIGGSVDIGVNLEIDEHALWSTGSDNSTITVTQNGFYNVLVYDFYGCEDRDEIFITVWDLPVLGISNDTTISIGYDVPLEATGAAEYSWEPTQYLDDPFSDMPTSVSPLQDITYTVTGIDANGCVDTAQVTITVISDYVLETVNLFTPNGDGTNDYFRIKNLDLYNDCELTVYNRWGNEVYHARGYQNDWDGTYQGQPLPEGSYYYMIKCDGTETVYDGSVSILRRGEQ